MRRKGFEVDQIHSWLGADCVAVPRDVWIQPFDHLGRLEAVLGQHRLTPQAEAIWARSPHLLAGVLRLSEYVTPLFPGRRMPLIQELVPAAVRRYNGTGDDPTAVAGELGFLQVLGGAADQIMALQAVADLQSDTAAVYWGVFDLPLPAWLRKCQGEQFYLRRGPEMLVHETLGARTALMARLVGHRELGLLAAASNLHRAFK